jgi:hypothetical protein
MTPMTRAALAALLVCPLVLSGCLATKKTAPSEVQSTDKKVVGPTEYEYVYVTGSLIPIKVPKGASARPLPNANPVSTMDADSLDRLIRRGQGPATSPR